MPAITVANMRTRVARIVGVAGGADVDETTLVDAWYNEAVEQFLMKTKAVKRTAVLDLTIAKGDYTIDADILAFEDAYVEPADGSQEFLLRQVDSADIRRFRLAEITPTSPGPSYIAYEGGVIMLFPAPLSSSDNLHIVYVPKPSSALSAAGDAPDQATKGQIPTEYHPVLESYVLWHAAEYSLDQREQKFQQDWERGCVETRINETRRAGIRTGYAKVGRRRVIPTSPGVDMRY